MQYLKSANKCQVFFRVEARKLEWLKWTVIVVYLLTMLGLMIVMFVSFPGYLKDDSFDRFNIWWGGTQNLMFDITATVWSLLVLLSAFVSIYAICKIFRTIRQIQISYRTFNLNQRILCYHICLMIALTLSLLGECVD